MDFRLVESDDEFGVTAFGSPIRDHEFPVESSSESDAMDKIGHISFKFWTITFEYFKKDVKKPEDNLIIFAHWLLLKNNFQSLSVTNDSEDKNDIKQLTEILPKNWTEKEMYKLHYKRKEELFLLSGVKACDSFIFNLYNVSTKHVASAAIGYVNSAVEWIIDSANNKDKFYEMIQLFETDLILPMHKGGEYKKNISTQTYNECEDIPIELVPRYRPDFQSEPFEPINPFPSYGMPDLSPFGGGGMVFDPLVRRRRSNNGPGILPMARFDPIRPINPDPGMPGRFSRPRPDHMRPPDFDDSLYM